VDADGGGNDSAHEWEQAKWLPLDHAASVIAVRLLQPAYRHGLCADEKFGQR
jgi:hypothetical protein